MSLIEILILLALLGALLGLVIFVINQSVFIYHSFRGIAFVRIPDDKLETMLSLLQNVSSETKIVDLGSGDGKIVIAAARRFPAAQIHGYEINPILVRKSRKLVEEAGLSGRIKIYQQSIWDADLSGYDKILIYFNRTAMSKLEKKISLEKKPGMQLISYYQRFKKLDPTKSVNNVHLYEF